MSEGTYGPLPTKPIFLHQISKQPAGSKVRFLGCVTNYDIATGTLILEHAFPREAPHVPSVRVDAALVLESVKSDELRSGVWLNIVGYVVKSGLKGSREQRSQGATEQIKRDIIQALIVWSAGAVRITDYETILLQQQEARKADEQTLLEKRYVG